MEKDSELKVAMELNRDLEYLKVRYERKYNKLYKSVVVDFTVDIKVNNFYTYSVKK